ncbi:hypothetical protein GCM10011351_04080 [Paraliobacillus quinghaiensis]|uniref:Magnesium transporter MgtE intracellular domain-containing protein n=1 Tax=Paraliobacillus quinghaiensis TaxID=470815 RepID=A0A917TGD4_9BACI|nr:hypothetical protein [Paraliobacillus quinghaiensis]GGM21409.1 hypothetical protein GCM10011351_04080 [Paraliobacillus quinghaiensis]
MAKATEKTKKPGFLQWLMVIGIPLLFALIIAIIIISVMGIDVIAKSKEVANQIPFLSSVVVTEEEANVEREITNYESQISKKDQQIRTLEAELSNHEQTIEELNQEVVKLTNQVEEVFEEETTNQEVNSEKLDKLTKSYEEMDAEKAAAILTNITSELAASLLQQMNNEARGSILSEMDAEIAADLTQLLLE